MNPNDPKKATDDRQAEKGSPQQGGEQGISNRPHDEPEGKNRRGHDDRQSDKAIPGASQDKGAPPRQTPK